MWARCSRHMEKNKANIYHCSCPCHLEAQQLQAPPLRANLRPEGTVRKFVLRLPFAGNVASASSGRSSTTTVLMSSVPVHRRWLQRQQQQQARGMQSPHRKVHRTHRIT
mmetsp:Transcript_127142/g.354031  ORF Transcript_127142/g.354031 Transcript_127142/m.354031 type:complete len:109 (-) Transcript_127142:1168-1494(-)